MRVEEMIRKSEAKTNMGVVPPRSSAPPLVAVPYGLLALYFLHAFFMTFPMTAYGEWLFDVIHMPPATTTLYYSVTFFPWNLKPLYGLLSDSLPLFGYRRKSYIVLCELCAALSLLCTGLYVRSIAGAFVVKLVDSVAEAFAQIMLGVFLVDLTTGDTSSHSSARVQSLANGTKNAASIAALLLGIPVYRDQHILPQQVISWTATLPLLAAAVCVCGLKEVRVGAYAQIPASNAVVEQEVAMKAASPSASWRHTLAESWIAFKRDVQYKLRLMRPVLSPMLFFFLCNALPGDGTIWYQYTFSLLEHEPECLQYMSLAGMVGRFLSCLAYAKWCTARSVRSVFFLSTVSCVLAGLPRLLLAPPLAPLPVSVCFFGTTESFVTAFTAEFALLQLLVVATFYCPAERAVQGLTYALYLSFMDFGGVVSGVLTSLVVSALGIVADPKTKIVDWSHLWLLVLLSSAGQLLVLVFLAVLPDKVQTEDGVTQPSAPEKQPLLSDTEVRDYDYDDVRV